MKRVSLNLKRPVCTEDPDPVVHTYDQTETNLVENTGIEREGGVTNIYETETTFATAGAHSVYTRSGDLLQVDASHNVRINGTSIGNVGPCAVNIRGALRGYSDAAFTAIGTIIGIVKVGDTIRVDELNATTGAVLGTRSTTFVMPTVAITSVSLVKFSSMAFADNLQFILSNNSISFLLYEVSATSILLGGQTWTSRTSASAQQWQSICWSPILGLFCAVSQDGVVAVQVMTSPDGTTWTSRTSASARTWYSVCWSPELNLFCAVAGDGLVATQVMTSPDGITWTSRTSASARDWRSVCWSPALGLFCAVAFDGAAAVQVMTSPDGITWTSRTSASAQGWHSVCWSPELNLFCAVAYDGAAAVQIMTSPDGTTWTSQTSAAAQGWQSVCWAPELGLFCAVADDGAVAAQVMTSTNGTTWISQTSASARQWRSVCWAPALGLFCAVAYDGLVATQVMTSPDGVTWTSQTSSNARSWTAICWSPALNLFCATAYGGAAIAQVMTSAQLISGTNFGWAFSGTRYIVGNNGRGSFAIGDAAGAMVAITDATWCVIDHFFGTGYTRAVLTFPVKKNAANLLTGIGVVGWTQAGGYSATPTYYGVALGAVTVTITNNICGPGYAEATFTRSDTATNIYYYQAPIMGRGSGAWYDYKQSQTQTLCNGYGRLTDFVGNTLGAIASLRVVMINGQPSLLSAGAIGAEGTIPTDTLGVPMTNVGEFDPYFVPHIDNAGSYITCIYRYNGMLFYFVITYGATNTLQRVSDNLYLVNCLSPVNAVNVSERTLLLGVNDYNGRILFRSAAAILAAAVTSVGQMQGKHANSIDTGDKLITQTFAVATNLVPGIELPSFVDRAVPDYGVNVYLSDEYSVTYQTVNVTYVKGDLVDMLYIPDTRIPVGMGYSFTMPIMQTEVGTVFMGVGTIGAADVDFSYLCYELGNDITGLYQSFMLLGQRYLFDGFQIWLASFNGVSYAGKQFLCPATGMTLVATSPTAVYFLSAFDNSIYTFDGGRSLTKFHRFNKLAAITQGVYNVRDNSLLLDAGTNFIWVRDSIITVNAKKANQAGTLGLYDTTVGIVIVNNTLSWKYAWTSGGTLVLLKFQTGYFGVGLSGRGIADRYIITLYSSVKVATTITVHYDAFDQDASYTQTEYIPIKASDYTPDGMVRIKFSPQQSRAMAASIGIQCANKIVLLDITVEYTEEADATIATSRSK